MNSVQKAQDLVVGNEGTPSGILGFIIKFYENPFVSKLIDVIIAITVAFVLISLSKIIAVYIRDRITRNFVVKEGSEVQKVGALIGDVIFYAMAMFSLFISFNIVGIQIGLLMGGISIGVGFAFRETLSNMISGIMIFSIPEYQVGNIVEFKMLGQVFGRIEEINMRHVIIRTFDMRRMIVPNTKFLKKNIKTYNAEQLIRYEMDVPVDISLDVQKIITLTTLTVNQFAFVADKEHTQVLVDAFSDKQIKLKIIFSFDPNQGFTTVALKSAINEKLIEAYKVAKPQKSLEKPMKKETMGGLNQTNQP